MQLDPNWFYSSLAQSAAGIVGLLGGILATRLQQQINEARERRLRVEQQLQRFAREYANIVTPLRIYAANSASQIAVLEERVSLAGGSFSWPAWYAPFDKAEPANVEQSDRMLSIERARHQAAQSLLPALDRFQTANALPALTKLAEALVPLDPKMQTT